MVAQGSDRSIDGIQIREVNGKRSSQQLGKNVFSAAARAVDGSLADRIQKQQDWRKNYLRPVRETVEAGAISPKDALLIASEGLKALSGNVTFSRKGEESTITEAFGRYEEPLLQTAVIEGQQEPEGHLAIPYKGRHLTGNALRVQLETWQEAGTIEPSCADAVGLVLSNPEWLDLSDTHIALLGAAAEMGPLEMLCRWRANVVAVDLPHRFLWERIVGFARKGSGRLLAPVPSIPTSDHELLDSAGADLLTRTPEIRTWLLGLDQPFVVGNYAYADGSDFVRVAAALDALTSSLLHERHGLSVSYLATPTDVYAVPPEVVDAAHAGSERKGIIGPTLRTLSRKRLYKPNYSYMVEGEHPQRWGISDCLVVQQGPNYALAKMIQRWRAITAREEGHLTSANVAPATRTASVVKNKVLSSAYRGASSFGVEVFEPDTSRALMAALLVHDLRNPESPASPQVPLTHPFALFAHGAAHGGLWRMPFEPRSVLPLAVIGGLVKRH